MRTRLISTSLACCLLVVACGGDDDSATTTTSTIAAEAPTVPVVTEAAPVTTIPVTTPTTEPMVLEGATVVVANGNIVGGSAGRMTDALAIAGFTTGVATNGSEKVEDSVVYYTDADGAQAVAESLGAKLGGVSVLAMPEVIPTESGTLDDGQVLLLLGNAQADKSLDELSGTTTDGTDAVASGSTIVVANVSSVAGSAGRMTDALAAAGYAVGTATNGLDALADSVIHYTDAADAQADAEALAAALGGLEVSPMPDPIPTETGSIDGEILLLLGSNQADKSLAELAG